MTQVVVITGVSDQPALDRAASRVENELGPIDVWVDNAFTGVFARFTQTRPEELRRVTDERAHGRRR